MGANEENNDLDQEILGQMLTYFLPEARENLDHLNLCLIQMENDPDDSGTIETVFRIFHTLKGSAAFAGLNEISALGRAFEDLIGEVRKGKVKLGASGFNVIYEGLDLFNLLVEKAKASDPEATDISGLLNKIDKIKSDEDPDCDSPIPSAHETELQEQEELLSIYRDGYNQLGTLKHLIYESVSLRDPESLAVLLSNQIHERMAPEQNGFWLVEGQNTLVEIARNGTLVGKDKRRKLNFNSCETLKKVIVEQITIWPTESESINTLLPEYQSPVLFPIKSKQAALGMMILDPEEQTEVELYQFISQFAAMIMRISRLHQKVDEQREDLDELTGILFRQNAQLSSLYHVEIALVKESDPVKLCEIVVKAVVEDLEAKRAAAFLYDTESEELVATAEFGGLNNIVGNRYKVDQIGPLSKCIETGRIITQTDYGESIEIGSHRVDGWIALALKGQEITLGAIIVEVDDEDIADPISILTNYLGMLLDNLALQAKVKKELS
jgi:chemotaxis protein histidine kinase CheA